MEPLTASPNTTVVRLGMEKLFLISQGQGSFGLRRSNLSTLTRIWDAGLSNEMKDFTVKTYPLGLAGSRQRAWESRTPQEMGKIVRSLTRLPFREDWRYRGVIMTITEMLDAINNTTLAEILLHAKSWIFVSEYY